MKFLTELKFSIQTIHLIFVHVVTIRSSRLIETIPTNAQFIYDEKLANSIRYTCASHNRNEFLSNSSDPGELLLTPNLDFTSNTTRPVLSHLTRTDGCQIQLDCYVQSFRRSFLYYFRSALNNHLSQISCLLWSLKTSLTVHTSAQSIS